MKKISRLQVTAWVLSLLPAAHALGEEKLPDEDGYGYTYRFVTRDTIEITSYYGYESEVVVPATIDGYTVVGIRSFHATEGYSDPNVVVRKVTLPDTVTYIADDAFYDSDDWSAKTHSALREIVLPQSLKTIGERAFYHNYYLEKIDIPASVTEIGRGAFASCSNLNEITIRGENTLLHGGYIHDGAYARAHGHKGISSESEWRQLERDLELVRETGCAYHMCHVSTKESVALIRRAKAQGLDVTCETAPHYLVLTEDDLREDGSFKMNPPLRTQADRQALIEGILDGTVDMIATDHAPHSAQEKARGLAGSAMGIVGLETAFPVLYTHLVRTGVLTLDKLVELMAVNPRKRFGFPLCADDYAVWDLNTEYRIDPAQFCSMGKSTPFAGQTVYGRCVRNVCGGAVVWQDAQV